MERTLMHRKPQPCAEARARGQRPRGIKKDVLHEPLPAGALQHHDVDPPRDVALIAILEMDGHCRSVVVLEYRHADRIEGESVTQTGKEIALAPWQPACGVLAKKFVPVRPSVLDHSRQFFAEERRKPAHLVGGGQSAWIESEGGSVEFVGGKRRRDTHDIVARQDRARWKNCQCDRKRK